MGRDVCPIKLESTLKNFNPLSPCGERRRSARELNPLIEFQPTLPVWGETRFERDVRKSDYISTHSPRVGRDAAPCFMFSQVSLFQPTLPVWGETYFRWFYRWYGMISTHSPRVGRDIGREDARYIQTYFNPLSLCGERHLETRDF